MRLDTHRAVISALVQYGVFKDFQPTFAEVLDALLGEIVEERVSSEAGIVGIVDRIQADAWRTIAAAVEEEFDGEDFVGIADHVARAAREHASYEGNLLTIARELGVDLVDMAPGRVMEVEQLPAIVHAARDSARMTHVQASTIDAVRAALGGGEGDIETLAKEVMRKYGEAIHARDTSRAAHTRTQEEWERGTDAILALLPDEFDRSVGLYALVETLVREWDRSRLVSASQGEKLAEIRAAIGGGYGGEATDAPGMVRSVLQKLIAAQASVQALEARLAERETPLQTSAPKDVPLDPAIGTGALVIAAAASVDLPPRLDAGIRWKAAYTPAQCLYAIQLLAAGESHLTACVRAELATKSTAVNIAQGYSAEIEALKGIPEDSPERGPFLVALQAAMQARVDLAKKEAA